MSPPAILGALSAADSRFCRLDGNHVGAAGNHVELPAQPRRPEAVNYVVTLEAYGNRSADGQTQFIRAGDFPAVGRLVDDTPPPQLSRDCDRGLCFPRSPSTCLLQHQAVDE